MKVDFRPASPLRLPSSPGAMTIVPPQLATWGGLGTQSSASQITSSVVRPWNRARLLPRQPPPQELVLPKARPVLRPRAVQPPRPTVMVKARPLIRPSTVPQPKPRPSVLPKAMPSPKRLGPVAPMPAYIQKAGPSSRVQAPRPVQQAPQQKFQIAHRVVQLRREMLSKGMSASPPPRRPSPRTPPKALMPPPRSWHHH